MLPFLHACHGAYRRILAETAEYATSNQVRHELACNIALLFRELDVRGCGVVSRADACQFFRNQHNPEEHVAGLFSEAGVWSTREDGEIDWPAFSSFWRAQASQMCVPDRDLVIMSRAMLVHRSWRWDDGRHLTHQHGFMELIDEGELRPPASIRMRMDVA